MSALLVVGVSQRILEVFGGGPEFFLGHGLSAGEIAAFGGVIGTLIPVVFGAITHVVGAHGGLAGRAFAFLMLVAAASVTVSVVLNGVGSDLGARGHMLLSVSGGLGVVWLFLRSANARRLLMFLNVGLIAVPGLFIFQSDAGRLVLSGHSFQGETAELASPGPVVLMVFDELPLASILDRNGGIDRGLLPGFARLSSDGTWYRNAVTTQWVTQFAVPAILTGRNPDHSLIPVAEDHPYNVLNFFSSTHEVFSVEQMTALCAPDVCRTSTDVGHRWTRRWRRTLADAAIVATHAFTPDSMRESLPAIDQQWGDFGSPDAVSAEASTLETTSGLLNHFQAAVSQDRASAARALISEMDLQGEKPRFYFVHLMLPHAPWEFLPDGQRYKRVPFIGAEGSGWAEDEWLVAQDYQRHLFQVSFVDSLVGELISQLESDGTYEEATIVVVADHGITFKAGAESRRALRQATLPDLVRVPLFIKAPNQGTGSIDDRRAEIIDIAPTLAGILGTELPWDVDGVDLSQTLKAKRDGMSMVYGEDTFTFKTDATAPIASVKRKFALFRGGDPFQLAPGELHWLLGASLDELSPLGLQDVDVSLSTGNTVEIARLDQVSSVLPISGKIHSNIDQAKSLAVFVNGRIGAIVPSYIMDGSLQFRAFPSPEYFRRGRNALHVMAIDDAVMTP